MAGGARLSSYSPSQRTRTHPSAPTSCSVSLVASGIRRRATWTRNERLCAHIHIHMHNARAHHTRLGRTLTVRCFNAHRTTTSTCSRSCVAFASCVTTPACRGRSHRGAAVWRARTPASSLRERAVRTRASGTHRNPRDVDDLGINAQHLTMRFPPTRIKTMRFKGDIRIE